MERQDLVIEHVGCRDRGFGFVEFGLGDFGVCIDVGLLIDPADALHSPLIKWLFPALTPR